MKLIFLSLSVINHLKPTSGYHPKTMNSKLDTLHCQDQHLDHTR